MKKFEENLIIYFLADKFITPFKKWKIFTEGYIDEKGKVIKEGISDLENFLVNIKRMVNESTIATFITLLENNREKKFERQYIVEQFEKKKKFEQIEKQVNEVLLKNNVTHEEYYESLLEKMKLDPTVLDGAEKE